MSGETNSKGKWSLSSLKEKAAEVVTESKAAAEAVKARAVESSEVIKTKLKSRGTEDNQKHETDIESASTETTTTENTQQVAQDDKKNGVNNNESTETSNPAETSENSESPACEIRDQPGEAMKQSSDENAGGESETKKSTFLSIKEKLAQTKDEIQSNSKAAINQSVVMAESVKSKVQEKKEALKEGIKSTTESVKSTVNTIKEIPDNIQADIKEKAEKVKTEIAHVKSEISAKTNEIVEELKFASTPLEAEIANHFLDQCKYGVAGSDGSWMSNYVRFYLNNHELLGICFADKANPYDRKRRALVLFNKLSLSLFFASVFTVALQFVQDFKIGFNVGFYVSLIVTPCVKILDEIATCSYFHRKNLCTQVAKKGGLCLLVMSSLISLSLFIAGIAIAAGLVERPDNFLISFFSALFLSLMTPAYIEIINWILPSYDGILIFPTIWLPYFGRVPKEPIYPLLNKFPFSFILGTQNLGGDTYYEDKEAFEEKFPGRICIDKPALEEKVRDSIVEVLNTPCNPIANAV